MKKHPMLGRILSLLWFKNTDPVVKDESVKLNKPAAPVKIPIFPKDRIDRNNTSIVYKAVKALYEADAKTPNTANLVMQDFFQKFESMRLNEYLLLKIPPIVWNETVTKEMFISILKMPNLYGKRRYLAPLCFKIRMLYDVINPGRSDPNNFDTLPDLSTYFQTIYSILVTKHMAQFAKDMEKVELSLPENRIVNHLIDRRRALFVILDELQGGFDQIYSNQEDVSTNFVGYLIHFSDLIEKYNRVSFHYNEEISELKDILLCYCELYHTQEIIDSGKLDLDDMSSKLDRNLTTIIVYSLKLCAWHNPDCYKVAFERCITPNNLKASSIVKSLFGSYKTINFFDYDCCNYQYHLFKALLAEYKIRRTEALSKSKSMEDLQKSLNSFKSLVVWITNAFKKNETVLLLDDNIMQLYREFSENPSISKFQFPVFDELFNETQLEDMELFNMFGGRDYKKEPWDIMDLKSKLDYIMRYDDSSENLELNNLNPYEEELKNNEEEESFQDDKSRKQSSGMQKKTNESLFEKQVPNIEQEQIVRGQELSNQNQFSISQCKSAGNKSKTAELIKQYHNSQNQLRQTFQQSGIYQRKAPEIRLSHRE